MKPKKTIIFSYLATKFLARLLLLIFSTYALAAEQTTKSYPQGSVLYLTPEKCERSEAFSLEGKLLPIITNPVGKCRILLPIALNEKSQLVFTFRNKLAKISIATLQAGLSNITITDKTYTQLDQASIDRINKEQRWINAVRNAVTPLPAISLPAMLPASGIASTPFGFLRYINGNLSSTHKGLDIANDTGTPVVTPFSGVISLAEELFYTGKTIMINHGQGIISIFGHLDTISVREGTEVAVGTKVGTIGTTGRSTGPHLHWGMTVLGKQIDPAQFLTNADKTKIKLITK